MNYVEVIRNPDDEIVDLKKIDCDESELYDVLQSNPPAYPCYTKVRVNRAGQVLHAFETVQKEHAKIIVDDVRLLLRLLAACQS
jgi:hypothetical protein